MKSLIAGMALFSAAIGIAVNAAGNTFEIAASYRVSIDGINTDGTIPPQVTANETDIDFDDALAFGQVSGPIDIGFGTARAAAFGQHKPGSIDPRKSTLAGVAVGGTTSVDRPDFAPQRGGGIQVVSVATVEYNDLVTIEFLPNDTPMHIQGFYRLRGEMNLAATKSGPNRDIQAEAATRVQLSGTGMPLIDKFSRMNTSGSNDIKLPDLVNEFSFDVFSGVEKALQLKLLATGSASAGGAQLSQHDAGSAAAGFTADFSHTLEWGGITKVTNLLTGEEVTNWTVTSASGFDYSQVFADTPEPSSCLLLMCGLLGFGLRRASVARKGSGTAT